MAKMNALKKNKAVKKYADDFKADPASAEAKMSADGYSDEEIFQITEALTAEQSDEELNTKKPEKKSKAAVSESKNGIFEKWAVEVKIEKDEDGDPKLDKYGRTIPYFDKIKQLRTVKITQEQADILNSQSRNTNLRYYPAK